jgi:hypothetical protein
MDACGHCGLKKVDRSKDCLIIFKLEIFDAIKCIGYLMLWVASIGLNGEINNPL